MPSITGYRTDSSEMSSQPTAYTTVTARTFNEYVETLTDTELADLYTMVLHDDIGDVQANVNALTVQTHRQRIFQDRLYHERALETDEQRFTHEYCYACVPYRASLFTYIVPWRALRVFNEESMLDALSSEWTRTGMLNYVARAMLSDSRISSSGRRDLISARGAVPLEVLFYLGYRFGDGGPPQYVEDMDAEGPPDYVHYGLQEYVDAMASRCSWGNPSLLLDQQERASISRPSPVDDDPVDLAVTVPLPSAPQRFGIELEFNPNGRRQDYYAAAILRALNNDFQRFISTGYSHSHGDVWHLKTDSSCGLELASPALTWDKWEEVERVLQALREAGAVATPQCGLHVHHEVSDYTEVHLRRLLLIWAALENAIFSTVKPDRYRNSYCRPIAASADSFGQLLDALVPLSNMFPLVTHLGKYRSLNCLNWWNHGTVEVRLHHGTLQPTAIRFWVSFTQEVIALAQSMEDLDDLETVYGQAASVQLTALKAAIKDTSGILDKVVAIRQPAVLASMSSTSAPPADHTTTVTHSIN